MTVMMTIKNLPRKALQDQVLDQGSDLLVQTQAEVHPDLHEHHENQFRADLLNPVPQDLYQNLCQGIVGNRDNQ